MVFEHYHTTPQTLFLNAKVDMKFFILRNTVERCITLSLLKDNQISLTKWDISIKESDDHFLCVSE